MTDRQLKREISSTYEAVRDGARWLRDATLEVLLPDQLDSFELATVEALTNIVQHGYRGVSDHKIALLLDIEESRVALTIQDEGLPPPADLLDPRGSFLDTPDSDLDLLAESGRGMMLINACVNEARLVRIGSRNELALIVYRNPPP